MQEACLVSAAGAVCVLIQLYELTAGVGIRCELEKIGELHILYWPRRNMMAVK
jgi:hypothetical protein